MGVPATSLSTRWHHTSYHVRFCNSETREHCQSRSYCAILEYHISTSKHRASCCSASYFQQLAEFSIPLHIRRAHRRCFRRTQRSRPRSCNIHPPIRLRDTRHRCSSPLLYLHRLVSSPHLHPHLRYLRWAQTHWILSSTNVEHYFTHLPAPSPSYAPRAVASSLVPLHNHARILYPDQHERAALGRHNRLRPLPENLSRS